MWWGRIGKGCMTSRDPASHWSGGALEHKSYLSIYLSCLKARGLRLCISALINHLLNTQRNWEVRTVNFQAILPVLGQASGERHRCEPLAGEPKNLGAGSAEPLRELRGYWWGTDGVWYWAAIQECCLRWKLWKPGIQHRVSIPKGLSGKRQWFQHTSWSQSALLDSVARAQGCSSSLQGTMWLLQQQ